MATARDLSRLSAERVKAHDREGWLGLFEDDAIVQDPVGPSVFDPEGQGHRGRDGIARFYDMAIAPNKDVTFEIHSSYLCGDEVANVVTMHITTRDDATMQVPAVVVYKQSANGRIASLRAFWETAGIPGF
jgi:ketosteroid isomerase-like protein